MSGGQDFGMSEEAVDDRTRILSISGELDALNAPKLGRRLVRITSAGEDSVVVDLTKATFIDSSGLGVILEALRNFGRSEGRLAIVCPTQRLLRPFEIAGLTGHLDIFPSREEALGRLATAS